MEFGMENSVASFGWINQAYSNAYCRTL